MLHASLPKSHPSLRRYPAESAVRQFFLKENFTETRTPLFVKSPGLEPHIYPFSIQPTGVNPTFLPTSPEFSMKKLLALGSGPIFQICSSFRHEPLSPDHLPEFSMLEFYEPNQTLRGLMKRVEDLMAYMIQSTSHLRKTNDSEMLIFRGESCDFSKNWPTFRIPDLFITHTGIDLRTHTTKESLIEATQNLGLQVSSDDSWDDLYFKIWLNHIEPKLPKNRPCFVTHYPVSQSSLCQTLTDETGFTWANRFEVYLGNFELGNAFDELRDPEIQRKNFLKDQKTRREIYGDSRPESPLDEEFFQAIEKMPPTVGIAMGLDRMIMIALEADHIQEITPIAPYYS